MKKIIALAAIALLSISGAAFAASGPDQGWNKGYEQEAPTINR